MSERAALRQRLRRTRRAVPEAERPAAAAAIDAALARLGLPRPRTRISAFHPMDGEIDPSRVLGRARRMGCRIYYPVVTHLRSRRMQFVPENARGAPTAIAPQWLDLVLVPLVGFDELGNRLGMGAGFYDRRFAFLRNRRAWRRPLLIGLAFEVQRVPGLAALAHDVPLWGVVTERRIYGPAGSLARAAKGGKAQ
jgi:5-formyltetrahydrofolate cyclo-ligase